MAFWSGEKLSASPTVVSPFDKLQVDCNSYTLRMGGSYYRTPNKLGEDQKKEVLKEGDSFIIPAGQFAYLLSLESLSVPAHAMAFISMRTGVKFQGLINVSGFHVDPGYSGRLVFAVYNASPAPININYGDSIFKIWFCDLDRESKREFLFAGRAQNEISNDLIKLMSREILSLQAVSERLREHEAKIEARFAEQKPTVDNLQLIWRTVTLSVIGGIVIAMLGLFLSIALPLGSKFGHYLASTPGLSKEVPPVSAPAPTAPPAQKN